MVLAVSRQKYLKASAAKKVFDSFRCRLTAGNGCSIDSGSIVPTTFPPLEVTIARNR